MKKDFTGGIVKTIISDKPQQIQRTVGRPKTNFRTVTKSAQKGVKEGETRATFIIREELLEDIKRIAYWERELIKDILDNALQIVVDTYIEKNGQIKKIPLKIKAKAVNVTEILSNKLKK